MASSSINRFHMAITESTLKNTSVLASQDIDEDMDFDINNLQVPDISEFMQEEVSDQSTVSVTHEDICKVLTEKRAMLLSIIMKIEKDQEIAKELLSVTAIQALTHAGAQFKGKAALSSYISSIAYNAACQHAKKCVTRKQKGGVYYDHERASDPAVDPALLVADETVNVAEAYSVKEQLILAEKILSSLAKKYPDAYKTWELYKIQEMSYEEISQTLGISNTTARGHVHRISMALSEAHAKLNA